MDKVPDNEIVELNIPTGIPLVYELDANLKPIKHYYLADEEKVKAAINAVANQGKAKWIGKSESNGKGDSFFLAN